MNRERWNAVVKSLVRVLSSGAFVVGMDGMRRERDRKKSQVCPNV